LEAGAARRQPDRRRGRRPGARPHPYRRAGGRVRDPVRGRSGRPAEGRRHAAAVRSRPRAPLPDRNVTDSVCDLPRDLLDRYQIQVVPLHLRIDAREYLDGPTIEPGLFFDLAERASTFPSSSQPSGEVAGRLFAYLSTYYDAIIAIHTSGQLSGTAAASARAAGTLPTADKISVVDSRHLSASLGLIVLRAAEAVAAGKSRDEIVRELETYCRKAEILVSVRTLKYMVRGGRVKPVTGALGKGLNLKPIVRSASAPTSRRSSGWSRADMPRAHFAVTQSCTATVEPPPTTWPRGSSMRSASRRSTSRRSRRSSR
jgi:hypothetical protein